MEILISWAVSVGLNSQCYFGLTKKKWRQKVKKFILKWAITMNIRSAQSHSCHDAPRCALGLWPDPASRLKTESILWPSDLYWAPLWQEPFLVGTLRIWDHTSRQWLLQRLTCCMSCMNHPHWLMSYNITYATGISTRVLGGWHLPMATLLLRCQRGWLHAFQLTEPTQQPPYPGLLNPKTDHSFLSALQGSSCMEGKVVPHSFPALMLCS